MTIKLVGTWFPVNVIMPPPGLG